jgi:hypothetical protein
MSDTRGNGKSDRVAWEEVDAVADELANRAFPGAPTSRVPTILKVGRLGFFE